MNGDGDLEFLLKNYFMKLLFEVQLKTKREGRPTPKLDLTQERAKDQLHGPATGTIIQEESISNKI